MDLILDKLSAKYDDFEVATCPQKNQNPSNYLYKRNRYEIM